MAYDLPDRLALNRRSDAAFNVLEADMLAEKASSLGHHGRRPGEPQHQIAESRRRCRA